MFVRGLLVIATACLSAGCFVDNAPALTGTSGAASEGEPTGGAQCGDGVVQAGEQCDIGPLGNGACTDKCRLNVCGDGYVGQGESCDGTPGCVACKSAMCGDGKLDPGEACDDGNDVDTDACTKLCKEAVCGDGVVQADVEACDDGNDIETDACTSACQAAVCGDGIVGPGETCDDGNDVDGDGCTNACALPGCGDGIKSESEECDDGNLEVTDGCLPTCKAATCGDGVVWAGVEACDDGNASDADNCLTTCALNVCGDGVLNPLDEACDHGPLNNDDPELGACSQTCQRSAYVAFVTSQMYTPGQTFTGVAEADAICTDLAESELGGMKIRGGRWKAWLATAMALPAVTFHHSELPYVKLQPGKLGLVAVNWADLSDGNLQSAINVSEQLVTLPSGPTCTSLTAVWTGASGDGKFGGNCQDWSAAVDVKATIGNLSSSSGQWSNASCQVAFLCSKQARLYCFEQPPQ